MSMAVLNSCKIWKNCIRNILGQSLKCKPAVSTVRRRAYSSNAYDYDGKTRMDIFNTSQEHGIMITGYSQYGFRFNNNIVAIGPVVVFPRFVKNLLPSVFRKYIPS